MWVEVGNIASKLIATLVLIGGATLMSDSVWHAEPIATTKNAQNKRDKNDWFFIKRKSHAQARIQPKLLHGQVNEDECYQNNGLSGEEGEKSSHRFSRGQFCLFKRIDQIDSLDLAICYCSSHPSYQYLEFVSNRQFLLHEGDENILDG